MAATIAGTIGILVKPLAPGFKKNAETDIRKQGVPEVDVKLNPSTKKATAELDAWRKRQEANAINLRVRVDKRSIADATGHFKRVEHIYTKSALSKAIRVNIMVAGAAAIPAAIQGILSLTTAVDALAKSLFVLPGLFAGAAAALGTFVTGAHGVSDAIRAISSNTESAAQKAKNYTQATHDLEKAQRDVVKAFKDANREIQDQKDKLKSNELSVEQARLNVAKAQQRLMRGGFESALDYKQAVLDVKGAQIDLQTTLKQSTRDLQDYYDNTAKTANETDSFKAAVDALQNSLDGYTKAALASEGVSQEFIDALGRLSPNAKDFVRQLVAMKDSWKDLQHTVQDNLFEGLGTGVTDLAKKRLPLLREGMSQVASGLNQDIKQLIESLGSDRNASAIQGIFARTAQALNAAKPGLDSFVNGFLHLSEVGSRFLPRLATAFDHVMGRFEAFVDRADKDGSLEKWIDQGLDLLSSLGRSMLDIGSIFNSVSQAYITATGNAGGFASTMEGGLKRLADYLNSPEGQKRMVDFIHEATSFMAEIKKSLPGIMNVFQAIGDAARSFATTVFPIFAGIGDFLNEHARTARALLWTWLAFKTVKPIWEMMSKYGHRAAAGWGAYASRVAAAEKATERFNAIAKEQQAVANASLAQNRKAYAMGAKADAAKYRALQEAKDAQAAYIASSKAVADAQAKVAKQSGYVEKAIQRQGYTSSYTKGQITQLRNNVNALKDAQTAHAKAVGNVNTAMSRFMGMSKESVRQYKIANDSALAHGAAMKNVRDATKAATTEQGRFATALGRMKQAIGTRGGGGGLAGILGGLAGALGAVGSVLGTAALIGGVIYAMDQWTQANDRARSAVDKHKNSVNDLFNSLDAGTGAATAATLVENNAKLRSHMDGYSPDDEGQNFDAIAILEREFGYSPSQVNKLALPTQVSEREAALKPADDMIARAVPGLEEWREYGDQYKANGVDEMVMAKALNGDPESIAKFLTAKAAIGMGTGDLGSIQAELGPDSGQGLRGVSQAAGALRDVGNSNVVAGQQHQRDAQAIPQGGLNANGQRIFGPLGVNSAIVLPDGGANIATDQSPEKSWIEAARDKGISVTERPGTNGVNIHIDADAVPGFFNIPKMATGGSVWGAGTGTSDSIPAMLSNGEYVINAKSAQAIGHDRLDQMNRFAGGGLAVSGSGSAVVPKPIIGSAGVSAPAWGSVTTPKPFPFDNQVGLNDAPRTPPSPGIPLHGTGSVGAPILSRSAGAGVSGLGGSIGPRALSGADAIARLPGVGVGNTFPNAVGIQPPHPREMDSRSTTTGGAGRFGSLIDDVIQTGDPIGAIGARINSLGRQAIGSLDIPDSGAAAAAVVDQAMDHPLTRRRISISPDQINIKPIEKAIGGIDYKSLYPRGFKVDGAGNVIEAPHGGGGAPGPSGGGLKRGADGYWYNAAGERSPAPNAYPAGHRPVDKPGLEWDPENGWVPIGGTPPATPGPQQGPVGTTPHIPSGQPGPGGGVVGGFAGMPLSQGILQTLPAGTPLAPLPFNEKGAQRQTIQVGRLVHAQFPELGNEGNTYREDPYPDHPSGQAVDLMLPGDYSSPENKAKGYEAAEWVLQNAEKLGVDYIIWDNQMLYPGGRREPYGSNGSDTDKHLDHLHIHTLGGGYPEEGEQFTVPEGVLVRGYRNNWTRANASPPPGTPGVPNPPGVYTNGEANPNSILGQLPPTPGINMPIEGPYGPVPFAPLDFLKSIGGIILQAILGFFGIDLSSIIGPAQAIIDGIPRGGSGDPTGDVGADPGPDPEVIAGLEREAAEAEAAGNKALAAELRHTIADYKSRTNTVSDQTGGWLDPDAAPSGDSKPAKPTDLPAATPSGAGASKNLTEALQRAGIDPAMYPLISGFAIAEGNNPSGVPTLGFTDSQAGTTLDEHARALAAQLKARESVAGPFPAGGTPAQQASWMATVVGQNGLPSDWQGNAQPSREDYVNRIVKNMPAYVSGGKVTGQGTGTSDSIPARLSHGEFVMNKKAVDYYGTDKMQAINARRFNEGGGAIVPNLPPPPAPPPPPSLSTASGTGSAVAEGPNAQATNLATAAADKQGDVLGAKAGQSISEIAKAASGVIAPKGSAPNHSAGWGSSKEQKDPRSILGQAPTSDKHNTPWLSAGIQGAAQHIGQLAATAVSAAAGAAGAAGAGASFGGSAGAGAAGAVAGAAIQAGAQIAGNVADGAVNVLSSFLVGSVTPSQTGQGYGAPLLPAPPQQSQGGVTNQSIHNGNVVTNNLTEYNRLKDRKDAQKSAPFMNRVNS